MWCVRGVVCPGCGVSGMWCVRGAVCPGCGVSGMRCVRGAVCLGCGVSGVRCVRGAVCPGTAVMVFKFHICAESFHIWGRHVKTHITHTGGSELTEFAFSISFGLSLFLSFSLFRSKVPGLMTLHQTPRSQATSSRDVTAVSKNSQRGSKSLLFSSV